MEIILFIVYTAQGEWNSHKLGTLPAIQFERRGGIGVDIRGKAVEIPRLCEKAIAFSDLS
jgi:hypothetical protein